MRMSRKMNNREIARLLRAIAAAYEIKGENRFRVMAYERAAAAVEHATSEIKDLWDDHKLATLPGIGASLAGHLDELFRTGKVKHFQEVMRGLPPAMFEMLEIPGVGAKTAYKLCQELGIKRAKTALAKLEKAAKKGKIRQIEGFGEPSEKAILEGLKEQQRREERMLLPFAWQLAEKIIAYMRKEKAVERIDPLGSLRRKAATVGDIDLAVVAKKPQKVIDHFIKFPEVREVVAAGRNTARIILNNGRQIDLKTQKLEAYGALLQHYTGSKHHNIRLRELAQKKGWSLSEYGIKKAKKLVEYSTEKEFYQALGMDWIPPELREDAGEIEAAQQGKLPKLVEVEDIKGDLHLHSNFPIEESHDPGTQPMEEMIKRAAELGWQYLGFAEHNPSLSQHTKKEILDLIKSKKEKIDKINYSRTKKVLKWVLNGLEIDIRPNGELAIPEKGLIFLDYGVASIHSSFRMSRKKMTQRVLKALEHPKIKILGHPTGRKLGQREGYELDWDQIFDFCQKKGKILEINAWPDRLDLPDVLVREAVKNGVKMVINTDSHAVDQMNLMIYGVSVARRGWAEKSDIINTLPWNKLKKFLF